MATTRNSKLDKPFVPFVICLLDYSASSIHFWMLWARLAALILRQIKKGSYNLNLYYLTGWRLLIRDIHPWPPFFMHTIWSTAGVVSVDFPQTNGTIFFSLIFSECSYMYCILMKQRIDFLKTKTSECGTYFLTICPIKNHVVNF